MSELLSQHQEADQRTKGLGMGITLTDFEILLISDGRIVDAMREIRQRTSQPLKDCRDVVLDYRDKHCPTIAARNHASVLNNANTSMISRVEVIDHRTPYGETGVETGRVYSVRNCHVELSVQDDGTTLKVFVTGVRPTPPRKPRTPEHRVSRKRTNDKR